MDRSGQCLQIGGIRADHKVSPAQRSFGHAAVDDVSCAGTAEQHANRPGLDLVQRLDIAASEQPGEECLTPSTPPSLSDNRARHGWNRPLQEQRPVASPHLSFASLSGDKGASVVGDPHYAVWRWRVPLLLDRSSALPAQAAAAAVSSGVKAPCSRSNTATASRPARMANSFRAVEANHPL